MENLERRDLLVIQEMVETQAMMELPANRDPTDLMVPGAMPEDQDLPASQDRLVPMANLVLQESKESVESLVCQD